MAPPRRVTVFIDSLLGGGAERIAVEAAAALDPDRYVPHLLVARTSGPLAELVQRHGLDHTILGRRRAVEPRAFARARRVVAASDLLHAHKFAGSMWGALLARTAHRPLVAHEHTFEGLRSRARVVGYRFWIAPTATAIVCVSTPVADALAADGVPRRLLRVVPNGVPLDAALPRDAARQALGLSSDAPVIGMIGRLRPEKRHELALEALARLRADGHRVVLCLVGNGPRAPALRQRADELGVADLVVWAGERPSAGTLVRAFDVTLLCSSFEGMPLAALEALVAGVPMVATAVGSLPELLADGGGRLVAPAGDPRELAAALADVLDGSSQPASSGSEATERARARFGLDRLARELEGVYDEALAGNPRR